MPRTKARPLLAPTASAAPLAPAPLYTLIGGYDLRAIMAEAHRIARQEEARVAKLGFAPWPYALRFKHALREAWIGARAEHDFEAETVRLAAMTPAAASLRCEREIALRIDSLPAMLAELAAIDARAAALGVRL